MIFFEINLFPSVLLTVYISLQLFLLTKGVGLFCVRPPHDRREIINVPSDKSKRGTVILD